MASVLSRINTDVSNRLKRFVNPDLKKADLNWWKMRSLKYSPPNKESVYTLKGRAIHFKNGLELLHSLKEIYVDEIYKIKFETNTPYILDCGANIGLGVLYLKQQYPGATIIAFEPDDSNFSLLQKNTAGLAKVQLVKSAVWNNNGTIQFASTGTLSSKITSGSGGQTQSINAVRLRDQLTQPVDFLKMDIEGAEYDVLMDCAEKLHLVRNLFIEYHGTFDQQNQLNEILNLLSRNSYKYYIREATECYHTPFFREVKRSEYDVQLNIFCFKIQDGVQKNI